MVTRGARRLIFLSRTGVSEPDAQAHVTKLRSLDVDVYIICGDVTSIRDVQTAVNACTGPIKGVIQAPLTLHVSTYYPVLNLWVSNELHLGCFLQRDDT